MGSSRRWKARPPPAARSAELAADHAADLREDLGLLLDSPFSGLRLGSDPEDQARRRADLLVKLGADEAAWGFLGRELEAHLRASNSRARAGSRALAAAWLVNRGDPRGLPALATGLASISLDEKDPLLTEHLWDVVVAGSLLQATEGGDAWSRTVQRVSELIEQFERRGDLETAARALTLLEFGRQAPDPPAFPMAGLARAIDQFFGQAKPPADWDDLLEHLESASQWREQ